MGMLVVICSSFDNSTFPDNIRKRRSDPGDGDDIIQSIADEINTHRGNAQLPDLKRDEDLEKLADFNIKDIELEYSDDCGVDCEDDCNYCCVKPATAESQKLNNMAETIRANDK